MIYELIEEVADAAELSTLEKAKLILRSGYPIPADLAVDLMQRGIDVQALENDYSL